MGPTSLEPFKNCNENLINYTDKKSYPYCYASIDNFYCYYYMTDNEKENTDCPKKDTIEKILDVIKMCIVTKRSPKTEIAKSNHLSVNANFFSLTLEQVQLDKEITERG